MKEGGGTREFYLNDTVTHILSDTAIEPDTVRLLDCHVLHVSTCIHCHYVSHYLFLQPDVPLKTNIGEEYTKRVYCCDWVLLSFKCGGIKYKT